MTLTAGRAPYVRDVELSRLDRAACFAAVGLYFASVVPSLPEGLEPDGHAGPVILVVMLGCLAIGMAIVSMMYLVRAERQRAVAHARSLLFDDVTGLHNRQYFIEMLNMEIRHAAREQRRFFVVLLQLQRQDGHGDPAARAHEIAAVATTIRSELQLGDRLAVLRNDEIAAIPLTNTLDGKLSEEQILEQVPSEPYEAPAEAQVAFAHVWHGIRWAAQRSSTSNRRGPKQDSRHAMGNHVGRAHRGRSRCRTAAKVSAVSPTSLT